MALYWDQLPDYMIPNQDKPDSHQQAFIVEAINELGYNPYRKPVHLYTLDEYAEIGRMYREIREVS